MGFRLLPKAEAELDGIWLYIARQSGSLIDTITERFWLLARYPQIGRRATASRYQLPPPICLTEAVAGAAVIPNISKIVAASGLSGWRRRLAVSRVHPPGSAWGA